MSNLTFSTFLRIVEDANADVQQIQTDIAAIDAKLAQLTAPLMARKMALAKQLQSKQQAASQAARQTQPMPATTNTTTPGVGVNGQGTPGSAPPGM